MSRSRSIDRTSGLQDHTGYWLNRLRAEVHLAFERGLAQHQVTVAQWNVLIALYKGEATTPQGLADLIDIDKGAITRLVDRLAKKGLAIREADQKDRRSVRLRLTETGAALTVKLVAVADRNDRAFFEALTAGEHRLLKGLIGKLLEARGIGVPERWRKS